MSGKLTTIVVPDKAWDGSDWPKYLNFGRNVDRNDEWCRYVPERTCRPMMCSEFNHADYYTTDWAVCGGCGGRLTDDGLGIGFVRYHYCPWCGRRLEEVWGHERRFNMA